MLQLEIEKTRFTFMQKLRDENKVKQLFIYLFYFFFYKIFKSIFRKYY